MSDYELGIVGLGAMGENLAKQALENDIDVVGVNTSERPELEEMGATVLDAGEYGRLRETLEAPRVVLFALHAGEIVDEELEDLLGHLERGDVIMEGGNSFWRDSVRRERRCREAGVHFLDTGISGGPGGAREGACFMVGGPEDGFEIVEPILDRLSVEGGLLHVGEAGSGHFVKLVHNGVEFGMLQAIAEGVELLEAGQFDIDLQAVFTNWNNGSVIESRLVELMGDQLREDALEEIPNYVEDTGEVNWLVQEAFKGETPIPVIAQSVMELFKSRGNQRNAYRAVAAMRKGFGGHPYGEDEGIREQRITGRVGNESRQDLVDDDAMEPTGPVDPDE